jgi:hypothetical protein
LTFSWMDLTFWTVVASTAVTCSNTKMQVYRVFGGTAQSNPLAPRRPISAAKKSVYP